MKDKKIRKEEILKIYKMVMANGSADRQWIIIKLTEEYSKLTGLNIPKE